MVTLDSGKTELLMPAWKAKRELSSRVDILSMNFEIRKINRTGAPDPTANRWDRVNNAIAFQVRNLPLVRASGVTVATLDLNPSAERRVGSSPTLPTKKVSSMSCLVRN